MRKTFLTVIAISLFTALMVGVTSCGRALPNERAQDGSAEFLAQDREDDTGASQQDGQESASDSVTAPQTTSNGLMNGASPITSALAFYRFDGEETSLSYSYDSNTTKSILSALDAVCAVAAKNWSLDDITLPIYGFEITATDGSGLFAAWSNGYWISQDGTVYRFDFSFAELETQYPWSDQQGDFSFTYFPCAHFLTQDENGWNRTLLTPVAELEPPDGVTMTLESWDKDMVTVTIAANSGTSWHYGEYYALQVFLEDVWYEIPVMPKHWGFHDIALLLQAGEKKNQTYYLKMYGDLPAGTYRIAAYGLSVENTLS
ncbi:MAG: hypothetical protein LBK75_10675 [Oscillospiraceae bacterium]|nr:hypothetical protein [Oscillospiraceae bacterium]